MRFVKMHGLGNDFILITDGYSYSDDFLSLAKQMCERHTGIGADGVLLVMPSECGADIRMRIGNSDGSEAEMCGNGIRCFAKYVYDHKMVAEKTFSIETMAGIMIAKVHTDSEDKVSLVTVNMGKPFLERSEIPMEGPSGHVCGEPLEVGGVTYRITSMRMGVPHTMIYAADAEAVNLAELGPKFELHPRFPRKTNMNFIQVINRHTIKVRTWERGAGITLACGTGACSCVVGSYLNGFTDRSVDVQMPLGILHVDYDESQGVYMTGPAAYVYEGEWRKNHDQK